MNIELIIFLTVWLISTEFIFFKFVRNSGEAFVSNKIISIVTGMASTVLLFGLPWMFAEGSSALMTEPFGNIAYVWYYGVISTLALFFLINYKIHKWLERKERRRKR